MDIENTQIESSEKVKPERICVTLRIETWRKLISKKTEDKKRSIDAVITELLGGGDIYGGKTDVSGGEETP